MPATDQGTLTGRYTLIPRTLIFLTRGDSVLLLKGAAHKRLWAGRYNGLGGHIERGESVMAAARRELLEESGLSEVELYLAGVVMIDTGQETGVGLYVFRGECPQAQPISSSEGALEWVERERLPDLPLVEDLPTLLEHVLDGSPGSPPFSAHYTYDSAGKLQVKYD